MIAKRTARTNEEPSQRFELYCLKCERLACNQNVCFCVGKFLNLCFNIQGSLQISSTKQTMWSHYGER